MLDEVCTCAVCLRSEIVRIVSGEYDWASQGRLDEVIRDVLPERDAAALAMFFYIQGIARHVEALASGILRDRGLDTSQLTLLFTLWGAGCPMSPTTLHRMLVQSPSGISHTLRRLQRAGLVRRVSDDSDARARHVELTAKGRRTVAATIDEVGRAVEEVFADATPSQFRRLTAAQRQVAEILAASAACYPVTARPVGVRERRAAR